MILHEELWQKQYNNDRQITPEKCIINKMILMEIPSPDYVTKKACIALIVYSTETTTVATTVLTFDKQIISQQILAEYPKEDRAELIDEAEMYLKYKITDIMESTVKAGLLTEKEMEEKTGKAVNITTKLLKKEVIEKIIESGKGSPEKEEFTKIMVTILKNKTEETKTEETKTEEPTEPVPTIEEIINLPIQKEEKTKKQKNTLTKKEEQELIKKYGKAKIKALAEKMNYKGQIINKK